MDGALTDPDLTEPNINNKHSRAKSLESPNGHESLQFSLMALQAAAADCNGIHRGDII